MNINTGPAGPKSSALNTAVPAGGEKEKAPVASSLVALGKLTPQGGLKPLTPKLNTPPIGDNLIRAKEDKGGEAPHEAEHKPLVNSSAGLPKAAKNYWEGTVSEEPLWW